MIENIENMPIEALQMMAEEARGDRRFAHAKSIYICLVARIKLMLGVDSAQLATNFYKLAEVYSDEGKYEAAQTLYNRAVEIWERVHPADRGSIFDQRDAMLRMQHIADSETADARTQSEIARADEKRSA